MKTFEWWCLWRGMKLCSFWCLWQVDSWLGPVIWSGHVLAGKRRASFHPRFHQRVEKEVESCTLRCRYREKKILFLLPFFFYFYGTWDMKELISTRPLDVSTGATHSLLFLSVSFPIIVTAPTGKKKQKQIIQYSTMQDIVFASVALGLELLFLCVWVTFMRP